MKVVGQTDLAITEGPPTDDLLQYLASDELRASISSAAVVLLPERVLEDSNKQLFRPGTKDVLDHFAKHAPEGFKVEIGATDDGYAEMMLHGAELWMPTVLVLLENPNAIAVALNVLSNYIYDRMKGFLTKDVKVHSKVLINVNKGTLAFTYDGPSATFEAVMKDAISKINLPDK